MKTFVCIGAGNVAWHLCTGLTSAGFELRQICSRTKKSAAAFAQKFNSDFTTEIKNIDPSAGFYIVAVNDSAINDILALMPFTDKLVLHTSGSTGIEIFGHRFSKFGVLYPLQTFSRNRVVDLRKVPFLIEGSDDSTSALIKQIAGTLSEEIHVTSSIERKFYHISAILACNFTNYMYSQANGLLEDHELDFRLLKPLMEETVNKALSGNPANHQTGPAMRGDLSIIDEHIKLLTGNPVLQKLYTFISSNIYDYYSKASEK